jgi:hypothetical protein
LIDECRFLGPGYQIVRIHNHCLLSIVDEYPDLNPARANSDNDRQFPVLRVEQVGFPVVVSAGQIKAAAGILAHLGQGPLLLGIAWLERLE